MDVDPILTDYESRLNRPVMMKIPEFLRNERLKHVIFSKQFDKDTLEHLIGIADMIRNISMTKEGYGYLSGLLSHRRAMLYFTQPSTRTFLSFMAACQILGLTCNEIRDTRVSSEFKKGESPLDSVRMFSSFFDIIIMRAKKADFAECCAYLMNDLEQFHQRSVPIINGGAGADEHPTQALLDIYTINRVFEFKSEKDSSKWTLFDDLRKGYPGLKKGLDEKTYCFCGDIGRGRTVRSLAQLLAMYQGNTMYFIAPDNPKLKLPRTLKEELLNKGVNVIEAESLDEVIDKIDLLYMTRVQSEHDREGEDTMSETIKFYLTPELVDRMKIYAAILHPFPRNLEIPFSIDSNPRAMYFTQARNGMWVRAALIAYLFDVDGKISSYFQRCFSDYHDYNVDVI